MAKRIVDESVLTEDSSKHLIRPEHITMDDPFWEAFDDTNTEISAFWIVRLMRMAGIWMPFTEQHIEDFYRTKGHQYFSFGGLINKGFIVLGDDDKYRVTHEFICQCFMSSPNIELFVAKEPA